MRKLSLKTRTATAIAAAFLLAGPVLADDVRPPEKAASASKALSQAQAVKRMQENVTKMQAQLARIGAAKTDEDRQKAMADHLQTLRENMMIARGLQSAIGPCPMMGNGGGMMGNGGAGMGMMGAGMGPGMGPGMGMMEGADQPGGSSGWMQMMERRMDMMQMMMQMMQGQMSGQMPGK